MYNPPHFVETRPEVLHRIMREHPLGTLVRSEDGLLDADHIPFEFNPDVGALGLLSAHVARANPLWQRCPTGTPVLVIFRGAAHYVSPNWYPSKAENHKAVPTWNYAVVQVRGRPQVHEDPTWLRQLLTDLTAEHEQHQPQPWRLDDAPPDYLQAMIGAVVGVEIALTQVDGKFKLSQNRSAADQAGVRDGLQRAGALATRALMPPPQ